MLLHGVPVCLLYFFVIYCLVFDFLGFFNVVLQFQQSRLYLVQLHFLLLNLAALRLDLLLNVTDAALVVVNLRVRQILLFSEVVGLPFKLNFFVFNSLLFLLGLSDQLQVVFDLLVIRAHFGLHVVPLLLELGLSLPEQKLLLQLLLPNFVKFGFLTLEVPQLDVFFQLMMLVLSALESGDVCGQRNDDRLLLFRFLLGSCDPVCLLLDLFLEFGDLVTLVVGLADGHFDILAGFPDGVDLVTALVYVGLLVLVRCNERLVDGLILVAELLEVVDVDDGVDELGEVPLDIVKCVLVELHGVNLPQLGLLVLLRLNIKHSVVFAVTRFHNVSRLI